MLKPIFNLTDLKHSIWGALACAIIATIGGVDKGFGWLMLAGFIGSVIGILVSKVIMVVINKLDMK